MTIEPRLSSYRDTQLAGYMKELRGMVKPMPRAKAALDRVEQRLKYLFRVLEAWDASHARQAETLLRLGNIPGANTAALMIFDDRMRIDLLSRAWIGGDADAGERLAEAIELERVVLQ